MSTRLAQLADEAFCLGSRWIMSLPKAGRVKVEVTTRVGKVVEKSVRVVVPVLVKVPGHPQGVEYLADVVTGGLYDVKTGRCMSSSRRKIAHAGLMAARRAA